MDEPPVLTRSHTSHADRTATGAEGSAIAGLLRGLALRGRHDAIIAFGDDGAETWDGETLDECARGLAAGLREAGMGRGAAVALCAPNSPVWIAAALAVLAIGAVLVPIDDLAEPEHFSAALKSANVQLVITARRHLGSECVLLRSQGIHAVLLEDETLPRSGVAAWRSLLREPIDVLPEIAGNEPAILTWTSGTTGSPKAFVLTHRNIATNVKALQQLTVVGPQDRVLLPLPLHHVYPFVVGMLTPLICGSAIVLPAATSGPALLRAQRESAVTAVVGVPRLYEAVIAAIRHRIAARGPAVRILWRVLLKTAIAFWQATGFNVGSLLFAPVRRAIGPELRLLVSGGAPLEQSVEEELEAFGWTVLSGYGLAETASLFTGNRPGDRRAGSVGRPLADGEIRIGGPDPAGIGEIELRGSSIIKEYLENPEANSTAFTTDGWFRTGDLGFIDRDGFLFVTGRLKETLVLGGGRKISPEDLEHVYSGAAEISEIAVLEQNGALVALVRPDQARLYARGATNLRDGIRVILAEKAQSLPSYQRLSGFALTSTPLPRTRLGKYRRFLLPSLYTQALAGDSARAAEPISPEDEALLQNPVANAVWIELGRRFHGRPLHLDTSLSLDLNIDSFGWMELAILLEKRTGIALSDQDLANIETLRDLLRLALARQTVGAVAPLTEPPRVHDIDYWLAPTGLLLTALGAALWVVNYAVIRGLFRLRIAGIARLPTQGPFLIAPNHASYLDVLVIAAALDWSLLRHTYWAGDARRFFPHRLGRVFCRAVHLFPVDAMHPAAALDTARRVLRTGAVVVWFPEGWRSPDGRLQRFLPGVGQLLRQSGALAVPALIEGAFEALPRGKAVPRLRRLGVRFGAPLPVGVLHDVGEGEDDAERVADGLRQHVAALAAPFARTPVL